MAAGTSGITPATMSKEWIPQRYMSTPDATDHLAYLDVGQLFPMIGGDGYVRFFWRDWFVINNVPPSAKKAMRMGVATE